jgi:hypothetical protein
MVFALGSRLLVPAQHFDLSGPDHFHPRTGVRLNPAADPNPPILKGLKHNACGFDRRHIAP